jgi:DNA-binding response OmpR family regulator
LRLLLVEDEPDAAAALAKGLREKTFAVDIAANGPRALHQLLVNTYDLVILDVLMPGMSGFQVCAEIRRSGQTMPVLMLTALDAVASRIEGLDCGADDYLGKPFDLGELFARVRALLRRHPALQDPVMTVGDLTVDTRSHSVRRDNVAIDLTAREYALLEYLMTNQGRVVGRAEISEHVWDETYDPCSNLIEVYVQRLRRKIDHDRADHLIRTRRGEGYQFVDTADIHV